MLVYILYFRLFDQVSNVREQMVDADALQKLVFVAKTQATKLGDISTSFDFKNFASHLIHDNKLESGAFDWLQCAQMYGPVMASAPSWR